MEGVWGNLSTSFFSSTQPESTSNNVVSAPFSFFQPESQSFSPKEGNLHESKLKEVNSKPCELKLMNFTQLRFIFLFSHPPQHPRSYSFRERVRCRCFSNCQAQNTISTPSLYSIVTMAQDGKELCLLYLPLALPGWTHRKDGSF